MKMHLTQQLLHIDDDKPFQHDLFEREAPIKLLTTYLRRNPGPLTLAVDSIWGGGKTTFLRLWEKYLAQEGFKVIMFNAWETDWCEQPFVALYSEIIIKLAKPDGTDPVDGTGRVLKNIVMKIIKTQTAGLVDPQEILKILNEKDNTYLEKKQTEFLEYKQNVIAFKQEIGKLIKAHNKEKKTDTPLVIMIDELDRCRPTYAIEFLEVVKHLFPIENLIIILAINRAELANAVRSVYGPKFHAEEYLRRFYDVDYQLQASSKEKYISKLLDEIDIEHLSPRSPNNVTKNPSDFPNSLLIFMFNRADVNLRQIKQAVNRLNILFSSVGPNQFHFYQSAVTLIILRTIWPDLYYQFIEREISDLEVVEKIFDTLEKKSEQYNSREIAYFEAVLAVGYKELQSPGSSYDRLASPLELLYKSEKIEQLSEEEAKHRKNVIEHIGVIEKGLITNVPLGFLYTIDRLELLPDEDAYRRRTRI